MLLAYTMWKYTAGLVTTCNLLIMNSRIAVHEICIDDIYM